MERTKTPIDIGHLEFARNELVEVWYKQAGLLRSILDTRDDGLYCYDTLKTLEFMAELYSRIAIHAEVLKHAKGEF